MGIVDAQIPQALGDRSTVGVFANRLDSHGVTHLIDRRDQRATTRVVYHVLDKATFDFEVVDWQGLEIVKRR